MTKKEKILWDVETLFAITQILSPKDIDLSPIDMRLRLIQKYIMASVTPEEAEALIAEHGRNDPRFDRWETIRYTPSEVCRILCKELECQEEDK